MKILLTLLALLAPAAAMAAGEVSLASDVFVERIREDAQGKQRVVLEPPSVVTPGDRLLFKLSYRNAGAQPAAGFVVTNPVPDSVAFVAADGSDAKVSVDGGKSWGPLATLKVAQPDGSKRAATAGDVTHIRWAFAQPIAAGSGGTLSFRGVVK